MKLTIDIGNTRTKFAVFSEENKITYYKAIAKGSEAACIKEMVSSMKITDAISCTVANRESEIAKMVRSHKISYSTIQDYERTLIKIKYQTIGTLGEDRIAAACGAEILFPKTNKLVLDAGTCLTYEFIDNSSNYLGGAISPGINMRYGALNNYTDRLPLLDIREDHPLIGRSTETSIISGVQNGILNEVQGIINAYSIDYENLTVICTGGDTNFFVKGIKSNIFASPNLILIGLNSILEQQH